MCKQAQDQEVRAMGLTYLDNAATTRISDAVLDKMYSYLREDYANPAAAYGFARKSANAVEAARAEVAHTIGARPCEIVFTSGGTESDNWALVGVCRAAGLSGAHVVASAIEHHAVLHTLEDLKRQGVAVTLVQPDADGVIWPDAIEQALRPKTVLVSVMTANNEIGTIEPIREIGEVCRRHQVLFHTDAVQAFGHVPLDVNELHVDLLSASAHKLHGPKGVGALYVREGVMLPSMIHGGSQESGRRAGTTNVAGIVGFGAAAHMCSDAMEESMRAQCALRDHLIDRLLNEVPGCMLNGHAKKRLPGNVNVTIAGVDASEVRALLDAKGICVSTGSACNASSPRPSHVLLAIGRSRAQAKGTLRLTLSDETTIEDIDRAADAVAQAVRSLSELDL